MLQYVMLKNLINEAKSLKRIDPIKKHEDYPILLQLTNFLEDDVPIRRRIWHVEYNVYEIPLCKQCNNKVNWRKTTYVDYCSMKCMSNSVVVKQQRKITCLQNYGVENPTQSNIIQNRTKQTNLKRRGVEYVLQDKDIRKRIEKTCLDKYGNVCSLHGVDIKEKVKQTNLNRYGVEYASQSSDFQKRVKNTNFQNCGKEYIMQSHISDESFSKLYDKEWLLKQHYENEYTASKIADILNVTPRTVLLRFVDFGITLKHFYQSTGEKEILDFLKHIYTGEIISNSRKIIPPYEIDIYLPELKMAVEFNGTYWHTDLNGKNRQYHLNKSKECKKKDISLIHIWEHDWNSKKDIIKSVLLSKLKLLPYKLDARKCTIKELNAKETKSFMVDNHIQGHTQSSINLALIYENKIVSMMTFVKSRYDKTIQYELVRFASKLNTNIRGAASKLFKHFKLNYIPSSIISYSDNSRNTGNLYSVLGFEHSHTSSPNFKYIKLSTMEISSRIKFQKHKLNKQLKKYDENISAWENMKNNGYDRIWDCGNDVYMWNNE